MQTHEVIILGRGLAGLSAAIYCQMIIAAGQGAIAGQSINQDLFEESLKRHALPRVRR